MPVASKIEQYFNRFSISYQALHHAKCERLSDAIEHANAVPELTVKSCLLVDQRGPIQVVMPYHAELDVTKINETLGRNFQRVPDVQASKFYKDCDPGVFPAFGMAYGLPVIVEEDLLEYDHVYAPCGCFSTLLRLKRNAFQAVMKGAIRARVSNWKEQSQKSLGQGLNAASGNISLSSVAQKLEKVYKLPPMPETAVRIMHLIADPEAEIKDLSALIERDPSLSAQIMRYARSALFAYPGELNTVQDAINRVLGFDRVSQLAIGLAASKAFKIPDAGPLGLQNFWQHALYAGVLNQALAKKMDTEKAIDDKEAYLVGLLHNFGILLIGHLFPPEFKMLNKLRETEPEASMEEIEKQVFGIGSAQEFISLGHGSMGAILLKLWNLPEVVIKTAGVHQQMNYEGEQQDYVRLTQLTNYLLAQAGIGDEPIELELTEMCEQLGLEESDVQDIADSVIEQCRSLDSMVTHMAA